MYQSNETKSEKSNTIFVSYVHTLLNRREQNLKSVRKFCYNRIETNMNIQLTLYNNFKLMSSMKICDEGDLL